MSFRSKSRLAQWMRWAAGALVAFALYVVLSRIVYDSFTLSVLTPRQHRLALPLVALFLLVAYETRWDGIVRKREEGPKKAKGGKIVAEREKVAAEGREEGRPDVPRPAVRYVEDGTDSCPEGVPRPRRDPAPASAPGEALFVRARAMPHQDIPDFETDGLYLDLLGDSAERGYAPAMALLGEYAMRRTAWVEAYYWMWKARKNGMRNLEAILREIRRAWVLARFPAEEENVNDLFTVEDGSIGRALLHVDSGHDAAGAREFLKANYPEYL